MSLIKDKDVVNSDWFKEELNSGKKEIIKLNLENNVFLLGKIPNKNINLWLNASDVFVLPSFSESFGVVAIEALACGIPVITTKNGGTEQIVNPNVGVVLKEFTEVNLLAKNISKVIKQKWDKKKLTDTARKYSQENIVTDILNFYLSN